MEGFTDCRDTDRHILMWCGRRSLHNLHLVNKWFLGLMDDLFWRTKMLKKFKALSTGCTNKEAYYTLPQDARSKRTIAIEAAIYNQIGVMKYALSRISDPVKRKDVGMDVLHTAIQYENQEVFNLMTKGTPHCNHRNHLVSSLMTTCHAGERLVAQHLLRRDDLKDWLPGVIDDLFCNAIVSGNIAILQLLLSHGANINFDGGIHLKWAIRNNNWSLVYFLLYPCIDGVPVVGIDPKTVTMERGKSILSYAVRHSSLEVIKLLLDYGVGQVDESSVIIAFRRGEPKILALLIQYGAVIGDLIKINSLLFHDSIVEGKVEMLQYVQKASIYDFRTTKRDMMTRCIKRAIENGRTAVVRFLITYESSLTNLDRQELLRLAKNLGHRFIVKILETSIQSHIIERLPGW